VAEAAELLRAKGRKVGVMSFTQVWPLEPAQFLPALRAAKDVVCVEGNATGQFARLLRQETGFEVSRTLLRYDGRIFTPGWLAERLG